MISLPAVAARVRLPWRALLLLGLLVAALVRPAWAAEVEGDITLRGQYWLDASGDASIAQVAGGAGQVVQPFVQHRQPQVIVRRPLGQQIGIFQRGTQRVRRVLRRVRLGAQTAGLVVIRRSIEVGRQHSQRIVHFASHQMKRREFDGIGHNLPSLTVVPSFDNLH